MNENKKPNQTDKSKVRYLCVENKKLKNKLYYRQEYLEELEMWGRRREITLTTFKKKAKEGYQIDFRVVDELPQSFKYEKEKLDTLIDLALAMNDRDWFMELTQRMNEIFA